VNDIWTIAVKELKEFWMARGGGARGRLTSFLVLFFVFGLYWPLSQRQAWIDAPFLPGLMFMILPLLLAGGTAADAFAGERERHTLETLLATRLSDRDIFLGKVLATLAYCLGMTWGCALIALIAMNVSKGAGPFYMYSESALVLMVVGSTLLGLLMTAIGVLVSLKAASVREAAQWFSIATLVVILGPVILSQVLPASITAPIEQALLSANYALVGTVAGVVVLALDIVLLAVGIARFQRTRLILE